MSSRRRRRLDDSDGEDVEDDDEEEEDVSEDESDESVAGDSDNEKGEEVVESGPDENEINEDDNDILEETPKEKHNKDPKPRKAPNPSFVPRSSRFFLHDDRKGGGRGRGRVVNRYVPILPDFLPNFISSRRNDDGDMWKHDKFDELETTESAASSSQRNAQEGLGRGGGARRGGKKQGGGRDRGGEGRGASRIGGRGGRGGRGREAKNESPAAPPSSSAIPTNEINSDIRGSNDSKPSSQPAPGGQAGSPRSNQSPRQQSDSSQGSASPLAVTPLKASAPEFRPSVPHSPSPTVGAMVSSAMQSDSADGVSRTSTPSMSGSSTDPVVQAPSPAGDGNVLSGKSSAEQAAPMNYIPNRRSSPQGGPQGHPRGNMHRQQIPRENPYNQQGGAWYPPQGMPQHILGSPGMIDPSMQMGMAMHPHPGMHQPVYYPSDPWAGGAPMGAYPLPPPPPHQYMPPPGNDPRMGGGGMQQPQMGVTQSVGGQRSGGVLHRDAPEFTPPSMRQAPWSQQDYPSH